jgi:hypothetical protein
MQNSNCRLQYFHEGFETAIHRKGKTFNSKAKAKISHKMDFTFPFLHLANIAIRNILETI